MREIEAKAAHIVFAVCSLESGGVSGAERAREGRADSAILGRPQVTDGGGRGGGVGLGGLTIALIIQHDARSDH